MPGNKTNFRNKSNRLRQLRSSMISSHPQTIRPSKYIRDKKRLPFNMVISATAYRSNPCTNPVFLKNINLSEYDAIFSHDNQKSQSDIVAELRKSMMNPKETIFEKCLDDIRECRSKFREESESSDDDSKDDDGTNEHFNMNKSEENVEPSFPMKTECLLKSFKSFESKRIDDVRVELNGLKVIKVFEYKETCFSRIIGDEFK